MIFEQNKILSDKLMQKEKEVHEMGKSVRKLNDLERIIDPDRLMSRNKKDKKTYLLQI